jgi:hypothetical protein
VIACTDDLFLLTMQLIVSFPFLSSGRVRMVDEFITAIQSVHIITKFVSSNPAHGEVYSIKNLRDKVCH